jgi:hypothetical protein
VLPFWPDVDPNTTGWIGLLAQAAGVALLAALEHFALGRPSALASAV